MSSVWPATICLSSWFSFLSSLSRLTSSAFIPPYWFRQRCRSARRPPGPSRLPWDLAFGEHLLRSAQLADDLSGGVPLPLHLLRSSFALCPGLEGLSSRADRFQGVGQAARPHRCPHEEANSSISREKSANTARNDDRRRQVRTRLLG